MARSCLTTQTESHRLPTKLLLDCSALAGLGIRCVSAIPESQRNSIIQLTGCRVGEATLGPTVTHFHLPGTG